MMDQLPIVLCPDASRTVVRPFQPGEPAGFAVAGHSRAERIVARVLSLDSAGVADALQRVIEPMRTRHAGINDWLLRRFDEVRTLTRCEPLDRERALIVGAFFSEEYSFEAAALFNPSIIPHPDQSGVADGAIRFIMSLRGIGEGHVSSVTFRTGVWQPGGSLAIDPPSKQAVTPEICTCDEAKDGAATLAFPSPDLSAAVLFPVLPSQAKGIEDLRLVRCRRHDGSHAYLGTYTAFDGQKVRQELLEADPDFTRFSLHRLHGPHMDSKGMALFPRPVGGRYLALGRQDNENIWLRQSDDLLHWEEGERILRPQQRWEFVQVGNCGPPLEIDEGWLLLTHGVGMVRSYCIGAVLLDRDDPSRVLARTCAPLLRPSPNVRGGYVPNVVYSCGALVHGGMLLLPHGVADQFTAFATMPVAELLSMMD